MTVPTTINALKVLEAGRLAIIQESEALSHLAASLDENFTKAGDLMAYKIEDQGQ